MAALLVGLAGCSSFVDKPRRPTLYDFGPGAMTSSSVPATSERLVLADIEAGGSLDGTAVLYRLGYADPNQLRPYAQSRWSAPPSQLIRQRLREQLGQHLVVLNSGEAVALSRRSGAPLRMLRLELEEFSHHFESTTASAGVLRLHATLLRMTPEGERLLAQRTLAVRRPAATPDAPGGARALAEAVDAAAVELLDWLGQQRPAN